MLDATFSIWLLFLFGCTGEDKGGSDMLEDVTQDDTQPDANQAANEGCCRSIEPCVVSHGSSLLEEQYDGCRVQVSGLLLRGEVASEWFLQVDGNGADLAVTLRLTSKVASFTGLESGTAALVVGTYHSPQGSNDHHGVIEIESHGLNPEGVAVDPRTMKGLDKVGL